MDVRRLKAVVFDLDGTVCFYSLGVADGLVLSLRETGSSPTLLGEIGQAEERFEEIFTQIERVPDPTPLRERLFSRLLGEHGVEDPPLTRALASAYARVRTESLRLFPGARNLLSLLRSRYRLGLLTNGPSELQWEKIRVLSLAPCFSAIVVSGDLGIYKPDPRIFTHVLMRLGVRPCETLHVGDSLEADVVGAKGAGLGAAWVRPSEASSDGVRPDLAVTAVAELREALL
jgi:HAD superfamily hydrolase (TIGR01509 family)